MKIIITTYLLICNVIVLAEDAAKTTSPLSIQIELARLNENYKIKFPPDILKRTPPLNAIHNWITKYSTYAANGKNEVIVSYTFAAKDDQNSPIIIDKIVSQDNKFLLYLSLNPNASTSDLYMDTCRLVYVLNSVKHYFFGNKPFHQNQFNIEFYQACRNYENDFYKFDEKFNVSNVLKLDENNTIKNIYEQRLKLDDNAWLKNYKDEYNSLRLNFIYK
jgi:hypothetical protein